MSSAPKTQATWFGQPAPSADCPQQLAQRAMEVAGWVSRAGLWRASSGSAHGQCFAGAEMAALLTTLARAVRQRG